MVPGVSGTRCSEAGREHCGQLSLALVGTAHTRGGGLPLFSSLKAFIYANKRHF